MIFKVFSSLIEAFFDLCDQDELGKHITFFKYFNPHLLHAFCRIYIYKEIKISYLTITKYQNSVKI